MIIHSLHAQHFRKYEELRLNDLPESGLILITGGKESGKSSIFEALVFALFGYIADSKQKTYKKFIRWGSDYAQTRLCLSIQNEVFYITRAINQQGEQVAEIWDESYSECFANSFKAVNAYLQRRLGYDIDVLLRSFYWTQKAEEHANISETAIQAMADLQLYQFLNAQLEKDRIQSTAKNEHLERYEHDLAQYHQQIDGDEKCLPWLKEVHEDLLETAQHHEKLATGVERDVANYQQHYDEYWQIKRRLSMLSRIAYMLMAAAVLSMALGTWTWLSEGSTLAQTSGLVALLAGIGFAGAGAVTRFYTWTKQGEQLFPIQKYSGVLAQRLFDGVRCLKMKVADAFHPATCDWFKSKSQLGEWEDAESVADCDSLLQWSRGVEEYGVKSAEVGDVSQALSINIQRRHQQLLNWIRQVEEDIQQEQARVDEQQRVEQNIREHQQATNKEQQYEKTLLASQRLLKGAALDCVELFKQKCQQYQKILWKTDTPLNFRFVLQSLEQNQKDIMQYERLPLSKQQHIALLTRIALVKQGLAELPVKQHALWFDEPLLRFNDEQIDLVLQQWKRLTVRSAFQQIWVSTQELPEKRHHDVHISCRLGAFRLFSS